MLLRHVFDHIFVHHHRIGSANQSVETVIDFRLASSCHFVVLTLDVDSELFHHQTHLRADVLLRSEEHTSELQSLRHLVCRLLLEKKKTIIPTATYWTACIPT